MEHPENSQEYAGLQVNSGVEQPSIINPYLQRNRFRRRILRREYHQGSRPILGGGCVRAAPRRGGRELWPLPGSRSACAA